MKNKILEMLDMQDAMNAKVTPDWRAQKYEWYRAAWIEAAEMMDHYGWKWWKQQIPDRDQVVLELIDIWHFGLSDLLVKHSQESIAMELAEQLEDAFERSHINTKGVKDAIQPESFRRAVEDFALRTLQEKSFDIASFISLMQLSELSFDELYTHYVGKNVLNFFRQDNGYKEGTYIKVWQGKEDNEHLAEILALNSSSTHSVQNSMGTSTNARYRDVIYKALKERYPN